MRGSVRAITPVQESTAVGAVAFVAYLITRTRDFGGDGTVFATVVDSFLAGQGASMELVHPHHPVYNLLVTALAALLRLVGTRPFVLDVGAAVSAAAAAFAVGLVVWLLRRDDLDEVTALLAGLVVASSAGMWRSATEMEVYALAAAGVVAWLAALGVASPRVVPAGLAAAAAMLGHAATGLLLVPTFLRLRRRPGRALLAVLLAVVLAGAVTALLLGVFVGAWSPAAWLELARPRGASQFAANRNPLEAWRALTGLVVWGWYRTVAVLPSAMASVADAFGHLATTLLGLLTLAGVVVALRGRSPLATTAALGTAAFLPLWLLWDVGNVEHATAATPLFGVLVAVGAAALPGRAGRWALGVAFVALVGANGLASALLQSRAENCRGIQIAGFVAETVPADGMILSVGVDPRLRLSLGYLSGRRVVDLTLLADAARREGRAPGDALRYWLSRAAGAPSAWATGDVLDPASEGWVERLGIPRTRWRGLVDGLVVGRRRLLPGDDIVGRGGFTVVELGPPRAGDR